MTGTGHKKGQPGARATGHRIGNSVFDTHNEQGRQCVSKPAQDAKVAAMGNRLHTRSHTQAALQGHGEARAMRSSQSYASNKTKKAFNNDKQEPRLGSARSTPPAYLNPDNLRPTSSPSTPRHAHLNQPTSYKRAWMMWITQPHRKKKAKFSEATTSVLRSEDHNGEPRLVCEASEKQTSAPSTPLSFVGGCRAEEHLFAARKGQLSFSSL
jgi:hypothetical protein